MASSIDCFAASVELAIQGWALMPANVASSCGAQEGERQGQGDERR